MAVCGFSGCAFYERGLCSDPKPSTAEYCKGTTRVKVSRKEGPKPKEDCRKNCVGPIDDGCGGCDSVRQCAGCRRWLPKPQFWLDKDGLYYCVDCQLEEVG